MPPELGTSIKFSKEQRATINNRPQLDFKFDDLTELEIKIGAYDWTFLNVSTNQSNTLRYKACNINDSELDLLRQIGFNDGFIVEPTKDEYKQTIYRINRELKYIVGIDEVAINKKGRRYDLNVLKISVFDSDERAIDTQIKIDKAIGMTFNPEQDESIDNDVLQDHLRHKYSWEQDDE
jgi:hypothetical protein